MMKERETIDSLSPNERKILPFLEENFEDIPRYIEYLIYKDIKENNILINDTI